MTGPVTIHGPGAREPFNAIGDAWITHPESVTFRVLGIPAPQGSKVAFVAGGRAVMKEASKGRQRAWRSAVAQAAADTVVLFPQCERMDGPLAVTYLFRMPCPKVRAKRAPGWHAVSPDISKVVRATEDGLTDGGLIVDDRLIAKMEARAVEVLGWTGAAITVHRLQKWELNEMRAELGEGA